MSLLQLPNELLLSIAGNLEPKALASLFVNHFFVELLTPLLNNYALENHDGKSALRWAIENNHWHLATLVIDKGADADDALPTRRNHDNMARTTLMLAAKLKNLSMIKLLLKRGANVYLGSRARGRGMCIYALDIALGEGCVEISKTLFQKGAIFNSRQWRSCYSRQPKPRRFFFCWPLLFYGTLYERTLIAVGRDPKCRNPQGDTLLHTAARYNQDTDTFEVLVAALKLDIQNLRGETALHVAVRGSNTTAFIQLLRYGADTSIFNNEGETTFCLAKKLQYVEGMRLLDLHDKAQVAIMKQVYSRVWGFIAVFVFMTAICLCTSKPPFLYQNTSMSYPIAPSVSIYY